MRNLITFIISLFCFATAQATITSGYYKILNTGYSRYLSEDFSSKILTTSSTYSDTDYEKMWKVTVNSSGSITMQNVYTGHYAQSQSWNSSPFPTGSTSSDFTMTASGDGYLLISGNYAHCASSQSYNVVGWNDASSAYSIWSFESISITDAEVATIQNNYQAIEEVKTNASTYNSTLLTFFTDASCSELNSTYKSYTDANLKTAMSNKGLPTALQNIAVKVKNTWSDETSGTYSKMFRVHEYKCYSEASHWCNALNATQMNDMSNPTGIFAQSKDVLYVFVGGDIPSNCSLRLAAATGNDRLTYSSGTTLVKGLNVIQASATNQQFYIMYSTSDYTTDLSSYDKLKIHIEGGDVIGYVDTEGMTSETEVNTLYKGILDYANTKCEAEGISTSDLKLMVLGDRGMFMFPVDTYNQIWKTTPYNSSYKTNYNIYKSIRWFDSVLAWEWGTMGFTKRVHDGQTDEHEHVTGGTQEYGTVCNNKALTLQGASGTNPYATWQYTSMPGVGGVESSYNAERADFDNWCVGHESGHDNQDLINLPSSTESSNNLFSNIVCYLTGYRMSRGNPVSTSNSYYVNGTQFSLRDISTTHRMYWQLYLYYHEAQNKTDFYPTLFAALRNDPLNLNSGTCFTEFYKKCCDAAQEDLTDYFTVWGFLQPFENTTFGDYTTRVLTLTQSQIDEAKAYVAAKNYTKNDQILFIEDRIETSYRWDAWANGTTDVRPVQDYSVGSCGTMGSVTQMTKDAKSSETGSFVYSISGTTLTLDGTSAGAGVIIYDKSGNILAYGNGTSIELPAGVKSDDVVVKAISTNGTTTEIKSVAEGGTEEQKLTALNSLISTAETIITRSNNKYVGYYRSGYLTSLQTEVTSAKNIVTNKLTSQYSTALTSLQAEIDDLESKTGCTYTLASGNTYRFYNKAYPSYVVYDNGTKLASSYSVSDSYKDQQWILEDAGSGKYYIKNVSTSKYISTIATSSKVTAAASSTDDAFAFSIESQSENAWALNTNTTDDAKPYIHMDGSKNIVGWANDQDASRWYIQVVSETEDNLARANLQEVVSKSEALISQITTNVVPAGSYPVTLTASQISSNHKESKEGSYAGMIDGDASTFFHSTWSEKTTDYHYWQIDLADNPVDMFTFYIESRTPSNSTNPNNFPNDIIVSGSNDGTIFTNIAEVTNTCASTGQVEWTSDAIGTAGTSYRYIRFTVQSTTSGNVGNSNATHDYFALAEFSMTKVVEDMTFDLLPEYSYLDKDDVSALIAETTTAQVYLDDSSTSSATLTSETTTLNAKYDVVNDAILSHERADLLPEFTALMADMKHMLGNVMDGEYSYVTEDKNESVTLQTTSSSSAYYLSTNHQETTEGPIANMIDGSTSTFFHSTWSTATTDKHYWQVDMGDDDLIGYFQFSMTSRNNNPNNFPSDVTISGSKDGTSFTEIVNVTNSLSTSGSVTYNSDVLGSIASTYRYLRFTVNKTGSGNGNNSNAKYYFFALSKFSLDIVQLRGIQGTRKPEFLTNVLADDPVIEASLAYDQASEVDTETVLPADLKTQISALSSAVQNFHDALYEAGDYNRDGGLSISDGSKMIKFIQNGTLEDKTSADVQSLISRIIHK